MKEIKLFDYQEDMKERIEKALRLHRSVMAQMPTGTGKTVLLASVVESFLREHSNCNVWIVAHRRELVSQIKDTLNKFLLNFSFSNHPVPLSKEGSTSHPDPLTLRRALKKVPVFGKTNKKAASYCTSEQFSDGQILSLFCLTQWLRYLYDDLQRVI